MLKVLEEWRDRIGVQKINEEGVTCTANELQSFLSMHGDELKRNYKVAGGSVSVQGASVDIRGGNFDVRHLGSGKWSIDGIDGVGYDNIVHIDIPSLRWLQDNSGETYTFYARICYSTSDWIDIQFGHYVTEKDQLNLKRFLSLTTISLSPIL